MDINFNPQENQIDAMVNGCDSEEFMQNDLGFNSNGFDFDHLLGEEVSQVDSSRESYSEEENNLIDDISQAFSKQPKLLSLLSKGINKHSLSMLACELPYDVDLEKEVHANKTVSDFLKFSAMGMVISNGYEKTIASPIKVFYVQSGLGDNLNLRTIHASLYWKTYPAVKAFNEKTINALSCHYEALDTTGTKLYSYMAENCDVKMEEPLKEERFPIESYSDEQIAKVLSKKSNVQAGLDKLKATGLDTNRLRNVSILVKAMKDCR